MSKGKTFDELLIDCGRGRKRKLEIEVYRREGAVQELQKVLDETDINYSDLCERIEAVAGEYYLNPKDEVVKMERDILVEWGDDLVEIRDRIRGRLRELEAKPQ